MSLIVPIFIYRLIQGKLNPNLPFVIFTVKEAIEDVAPRTNMMEVVKNYYHRKVSATIISTALFSQISKILLHILKEKNDNAVR